MLKRLNLAVLCFVFIALLCADTVMAAATFDYGGGFRLRYESWYKVADLGTKGDPSRDFFRLRSNLWGKADLNENIGLFLGITNEAKYYTRVL